MGVAPNCGIISVKAPEKTPQPAEPQLEQKIEDLKEQLETLPPEEEQVYTTQEDPPQTDSSTTKPVADNNIKEKKRRGKVIRC